MFTFAAGKWEEPIDTWESPTRPAPLEFPQGLTAARVLGCSGAM